MPTIKKPRREITFRQMMAWSLKYYKQEDNKKKRAKQDVVSAKIVLRNNYIYDRSTREWKQVPGRSIKFVFNVKTDPESYKRTDTLRYHIYPVYFVFKDISLGLDTPFKFREGSFAAPNLSKAKVSPKRRQAMMENNVKRGIQFNFFFYMMRIASVLGILFGPDTTNKKLPKKTNPKFRPFFGKHAIFCCEKFIIPLLKHPGFQVKLRTLAKN